MAENDMQKRDLLVTICDVNFVKQAKQLFSSVYYNSGWQGDYMLLTNNLPEEDIAWFRSKGIIVYSPPLFSAEFFGRKSYYPPILYSKLYLFHEYFKKWRKIIFLDSDIIVRASLGHLLSLDGFNAPEAVTIRLREEFINDKRVSVELGDKYNLRSLGFSTGVFAFDSSIIDKETLPTLVSLYDKYHDLCEFGEEAIMNLFFYKKWNKLSLLFNYTNWYMKAYYCINKPDFPAPVIHAVCSVKPWREESKQYKEWTENLAKAEEIDLDKRLPAKKVWTERDIKRYSAKLFLMKGVYYFWSAVFFVDKQIGRVGLLIKKKNPQLYEKIRRKGIKNRDESI